MQELWGEESEVRMMEDSRHMVEEVLALCLQRITVEETNMNTERGETSSLIQGQFTGYLLPINSELQIPLGP